MRIRTIAAGAVWASTACAPKARPLEGAPAPARLPAAQLAPGYQRVNFRWEFVERDVAARGDGVARIAAPDSARVDFFLDGGYGGGWAILIGNRLLVPDGAGFMRRYVPPPPMLWAALGRLAVPAATDTVERSTPSMFARYSCVRKKSSPSTRSCVIKSHRAHRGVT